MGIVKASQQQSPTQGKEKMMTPNEFFKEWSENFSNLELSVRDVAGSFPISSQAATKMLQSFVEQGKVTARFYTKSRVTVYTLVK